jgi:8-oxo-dGTP pyrophosphatase MutT (NUDIX family)
MAARDTGRVLLLKRSVLVGDERRTWATPGGKIDGRESARR